MVGAVLDQEFGFATVQTMGNDALFAMGKFWPDRVSDAFVFYLIYSATSEVEACNFDICLYPRTTTCCGGLDVVTINNKWLCAAPENIL